MIEGVFALDKKVGFAVWMQGCCATCTDGASSELPLASPIAGLLLSGE
jgi:hypothetical protein